MGISTFDGRAGCHSFYFYQLTSADYSIVGEINIDQDEFNILLIGSHSYMYFSNINWPNNFSTKAKNRGIDTLDLRSRKFQIFKHTMIRDFWRAPWVNQHPFSRRRCWCWLSVPCIIMGCIYPLHISINKLQFIGRITTPIILVSCNCITSLAKAFSTHWTLLIWTLIAFLVIISQLVKVWMASITPVTTLFAGLLPGILSS